MSKQIHVVPAPAGGWIVKETGSAKAAGSFERKAQAVAFARKLAAKELGARAGGNAVVVHDESALDFTMAKDGKMYAVEVKTAAEKPRPAFGSAKGKFVIAPDFDETPADLADYVE